MFLDITCEQRRLLVGRSAGVKSEDISITILSPMDLINPLSTGRIDH